MAKDNISQETDGLKQPLSDRKGLLALSPLLVFILLYLGLSIIAGNFSRVPMTVIFLIASIYAIAISGRFTLKTRIDIYSRGASTPNLLLMLWIYVLAGAFAQSAKSMGAIDATVNLTLAALPPALLLPGLFIAACFVSISIGTSVGTVVALVPIAAGIATQTGNNIALLTAAIVGGAYFGDNLSFISDTTVVATQTQGCRMKDKFKVNSLIVTPAVIVVLVIYVLMGWNYAAPAHVGDVSYIRVLPYLAVLITAICGLNVMAVLVTGILLCGIIGMAGGDYGYQGLNFAPQDEEGTIVKITRKSTVYNTNGRTYYNTYALNKAMEPLVGSMGRTFRIETDNPRRPSYMRLVDLKESTNVITLSGNEVDLPLQVLDETEEN